MANKIKVTENSTIPEVFNQCVDQFSNRVAQVDGDERMTYKAFGNKVDRLASALIDLGVKPGDKVALVLPDGNAFPVGMFAIIQMGGVSVGINPNLQAPEFRHILSDSDAVAVIVAEKFNGVDPLRIIREMREELPLLKHIIVDGKVEEYEINLKELIEASEVKEFYYKADPNELAALIYTSGTTGLPKGSMHSHHTMLYARIGAEETTPILVLLPKIIKRYGLGYVWRYLKNLGKPLRAYYSMPPYSGAGTMGVLGLYLSGHTVVHLDRFIPTKVLELIEKEKITGIGLPPALGMMLIRQPKFSDYDLSSLMYVLLAAAPVPSTLIDEFQEKIGCPVINGFGATELFGGPTKLDPFQDSIRVLRETVGKVKPDYEVSIVDDNRQPLPFGEVGELAIRGGVRMLGYYKADELTQKTFDVEGWYYTGDQATLDEDGYVRIVGRIKDMIIRGGQNIYPAELESVLLTHPKIKQAAVIGVPDAIAGEKVLAFVIPEIGFTVPSPVEVLNFCRKEMAAYKVPANVFYVDSFPLNATGKVLKRVLRENAMRAA